MPCAWRTWIRWRPTVNPINRVGVRQANLRILTVLAPITKQIEEFDPGSD